jgi:hypothetical protein
MLKLSNLAWVLVVRVLGGRETEGRHWRMQNSTNRDERDKMGYKG